MLEITDENIKSIREICTKPMEYDMAIAEDAQRSSQWFLAVATASFSLTILRGHELAPSGSSEFSEYLLLTGSLFSVLSILTGTCVRHFRNKSRMHSRKVMTNILGQCTLLHMKAIELPKDLTLKKLTKGVMDGKYLGDSQSISDHKKDNEKLSRTENRARKLAAVQQVLVAVAYACILVLFVVSRG